MRTSRRFSITITATVRDRRCRATRNSAVTTHQTYLTFQKNIADDMLAELDRENTYTDTARELSYLFFGITIRIVLLLGVSGWVYLL
jgi:hypothetical protein